MIAKWEDYFTHSVSTLLSAPCYPAWEVMEGEAVEIFALPFQRPQIQGSANGSSKNFYLRKIEPLCYRHLNFDELIRHQIQALIFCFFVIKNKEEALRRPTCTDLSSVAEARIKWLVNQ